MKNISNLSFSIAVFLLLAAGGLNSCMDFEPEDKMGDNQVWNSQENFQLFANQFYGWLRDLQASDYQNGVSDGVHSDFRSDLICTSNENVYSMGTNSKPATDANYGTLYKRIYYTNLLIKPSAMMCRFIRALSLRLLKKWRNISVGMSPTYSRWNVACHTSHGRPPKSRATVQRQSSMGSVKP